MDPQQPVPSQSQDTPCSTPVHIGPDVEIVKCLNLPEISFKVSQMNFMSQLLKSLKLLHMWYLLKKKNRESFQIWLAFLCYCCFLSFIQMPRYLCNSQLKCLIY